MKAQSLIGYDFGLAVEVSWYPPVTALRFVCQEKAPKGVAGMPKGVAGIAWVDPKEFQVKLWRGGKWQPVAKVTATSRA